MTTEDDELRQEAEADALLAFDEGEADASGAWAQLQTRAFPRRSFTGPVLATCVLIAAAVLLVVFWPSSMDPQRGRVDAKERTTVALASRGVAVVERGGALQWEVDAQGRARVQQSAGAVFYRVEPGDAFVVETEAGTVTVTGTCFTVETKMMRDKIKLAASATAGAAAAAAVFLTVHEGSVVLANEGGDVEVAAGQRARASATSAPRLDDSDPEPTPQPRYKTLVRENTQQRRALRELQKELAAMQNPDQTDADEPDPDSPESRLKAARQCAVNGGCDGRMWTDPSPAELAELAKCGRLLVDTPSFMAGADFFPPGYVIESAGLSEADAQRYAEVAEGFYDDSGKTLAAFARELGVPEPLVERLAPSQLSVLVGAVVENTGETRHRMANERAGVGQRVDPAEQSASERAMRFKWDLGNTFEDRLEAEFGTDAAREMRRAAGGWSTKASIAGRECID